ncbi:MAG: methyltransferase domain-containing protein [Planctomycetota bacterium]
MRDANEKYHDHVASIYDDIYKSSYWDFYRDLSWNYMKEHLPRSLSVRTHDVGCGTGTFGLRLLKAGFNVLFSDLSQKMLDVARRKVEEAGYLDKAEFLKLDMADMSVVPDASFGFICAQGDPLSLCEKPKKAVKEVERTLAPGGVAILSVDNRVTGYEFFLEKGDLKGLQEFHKKGILTWLAKRQDERFPCHTFDAEDLKKLASAAGLVTISVIGKTCLPVRKHPALLDDYKAYKELLHIEKKLAKDPQNLGRASHLQITLQKP